MICKERRSRANDRMRMLCFNGGSCDKSFEQVAVLAAKSMGDTGRASVKLYEMSC